MSRTKETKEQKSMKLKTNPQKKKGKIHKTKRCFFEKIHKIDKPLARPTKRKRKDTTYRHVDGRGAEGVAPEALQVCKQRGTLWTVLGPIRKTHMRQTSSLEDH